MSSWSIAEVKLEWKNSSRLRHSRIRQLESMLSDKDNSVRELKVSLLLVEISLNSVS